MPRESDEDLIADGYAAAVRNLFAVLVSDTIAGDAQAEANFANGLRITRVVRARALELAKTETP